VPSSLHVERVEVAGAITTIALSLTVVGVTLGVVVGLVAGRVAWHAMANSVNVATDALAPLAAVTLVVLAGVALAIVVAAVQIFRSLRAPAVSELRAD
jgi:hypothetical protein